MAAHAMLQEMKRGTGVEARCMGDFVLGPWPKSGLRKVS